MYYTNTPLADELALSTTLNLCIVYGIMNIFNYVSFVPNAE
jgi:hypothetical protein